MEIERTMRSLILLLALSSIAWSGGDVALLARCAQGEAEILGDEGMAAVLCVVGNRLESDLFPDDLPGVLAAFHGCGRIDEPSTDAVRLALSLSSKRQGCDGYAGMVYAFSLQDARRLGLPYPDLRVPEEPLLAGGREWQLWLYEDIDWRAWHEEARSSR